MNEYDVKRLALVLSVQAEIEGLKAANILSAQNNEAPEYGIGVFIEMSSRLISLAKCPNEHLHL